MAFRRVRRVPGAEVADFVQAALAALWKAAQGWRPDGGAAFSTFAWHHIRGELNCECWRQCLFGFKAGKAVVYRDWQLPTRQPLPRYRDKQADPDPVPEPYMLPDATLDDRDLLEFILLHLNAGKLREVARRYWVEGQSSKDVARDLGVSVCRIEQLHRKAYQKMVQVARRLKEEWGNLEAGRRRGE